MRATAVTAPTGPPIQILNDNFRQHHRAALRCGHHSGIGSAARSQSIDPATKRRAALSDRCRRGSRSSHRGGRPRHPPGGGRWQRRGARRRHLLVDRLPRQPAGHGGGHLWRHLQPPDPGVDVAGPRRPGVRRAPRGHRARLRGDGERHRVRVGRQHRSGVVVHARRDAGAVGRPPLWGHQPVCRHHRHPGRRCRSGGDLRRGRRAGWWCARSLSSRFQHLQRHDRPRRSRQPARAGRSRHFAAHRSEPEQWQRRLRLRRQRRRLRDLQRLGRLGARGRRDAGLLPGGAHRSRRGRLDGRRRTRGRLGGQHLGDHRQWLVVHPL